MVEAVLVGSLVLILSFEYFAKGWQNLAEAFKENPRGIVKYFGSAAVFWIAMASLPSLLISIYMRHHGFFAFEVFDVNRLSFHMLSLNIFFNLAILTLVFLLLALPTARRWLNWYTMVILVLMAILPLAYLLFGRTIAYVTIFTFCLLLWGYLMFVFHFDFSRKAKLWWAPLLFAGAYLYLAIAGSRWAATFVGNELYQMRVGAMDVEIIGEPWSGPGRVVAARLVLKTSEFYYLKFKDDPHNLVIVKADSVVLRYKPEQGYSEE